MNNDNLLIDPSITDLGARVDPNTQYSKNVVFNLDINPKQRLFFDTVLGAIQNKNPHRYLFFGGAVRGGKTAISLFTLHFLCRNYPGLRCHVVRNTFPNLANTTIPSFNKLCPSKHIVNRGKAYYNNYVEYTNGSKIFFFAENFKTDKDLDRFKGLETNIFLLEQLEELQHATFFKAIERCGSHYLKGIDNLPGLVLATFNPTTGWLKEQVHEKAMKGELPDTYYYLNAKPTDNAFVTEEQWRNWSMLDSVSYARFIEGDWDAKDLTTVFMYSFLRETHVKDVRFNPREPLYISFDFNVSPLTAILFQYRSRDYVHVLKEVRLINSNITDMCLRIKQQCTELRDAPAVFITGDPSGRNRNSITGNINHYTVIQDILGIPTNRFEVLSNAPTYETSQVLCNSVLERHPNFYINPSCKYLIQDLQNVCLKDMGNHGKMGDEGHLLDCLRYALHTYLHNFTSDPLRPEVVMRLDHDPTNSML